MIAFEKYNLDEEDIKFFLQIEDYCINGQSELVLAYKGKKFSIEPSGKEITVVDCTGIIGEYSSFDDLFLYHKIDGTPLISLIKDLKLDD